MTGRLESKVLLVTGGMMGMGRAFAARAGSEDEVAAFTTFLLSDKATFVTGAALAVDGGFTAQ
jgi:NAD(P)-dependent dehydrogenase (short-subunit alcohol dehydrogenase family)